MTSSLELVTGQFPQLRDQVRRLHEEDELFRELCEDYATCALALDRQDFEASLRREYAALRLRLETELLGYLHEAEASNARKK